MSDFKSAATYQLIWPDSLGTVYTINGGSGLSHVSLDGTGIPTPLHSFNPYILSDGGIDDGYKLDVRRMVWKIHITGATEELFDTARAYLFFLFRPLTDPYRLRVVTVSGAQRQIDCYVDGPIEIDNGDGFTAIATIPLIAPDPIWYDPTARSYIVSSWPQTSITVPYSGTWYEWPIIKVIGQIGVTLTNIAFFIGGGGTVFRQGKVSVTAVPSGHTWTIDLHPAKKTIVNQVNANVLNTAIGTSSIGVGGFLEFRLWPEPIKASGDNTMTVSHTSPSGSPSIEFIYFDRYIAL